MILILNNPWVKEYLSTIKTAIQSELEENKDEAVGTAMSRLLYHDVIHDTKPNGLSLTALILTDLGLTASSFTPEALEEGCELIKEYELLTDCTGIDWDLFIANKILPFTSEHLKSNMLRVTLEAYFKDVFLFMMSRLTQVEIGPDNESIWFHFGEQ